jgi:sialate O-acetylesterase
MVLQRDAPARIWGWADPGEGVRVAVAEASAEAKADGDGRWAVDLAPQPAGGPYRLTIAGDNTLTFEDVWLGEVWVASGQSNMEWPLSRSDGGDAAAAAGCEGLRLFTVARATSLTPRDDVGGEWAACDEATAPSFSAVAFHFGQELHRRLGTRIGLIHSSWGGTPAEAWTSRAALEAQPTLRPMVAGFDAASNDPEAQKELAAKLEAWETANYHQDTGNEGFGRGWARPGFDSSGWKAMALPGQWEQAGLPIDGAVWFRRTVDIPAPWAGRDLTLSLGAIDDFDTTYFAGEEIGGTGKETPGYWSVPRRYAVPGRLVKAGSTAIAVRAFDHYGNGGFAGSAPEMTLAPSDGAGTSLSLAGAWAYAVERGLEPSRPDFATQPRYPSPDNSSSPTVLYGGMLAPLTPYTIRGVIWYQGEANAGAAGQYRTLFPAMIRDWRGAWGRGDFPFLFVQLANYMERKEAPGESAWAELREAQMRTLVLPNTGMAVIIDIGEADDIHPRNKTDVGLRLARWALADTYGEDVVRSGPLYDSSAVEGGAVRVRFHHRGGGLSTSDGEPPRAFAVAGADRTWHWAEARIDGAAVLVSSPAVPQPVALRYAWADNPVATLQNAEGLPASPFRTDDWPTITGPGEVSDGRDLVRAMHARYDGRWYRDFMLVQDVTYLGDGRAGDEERMTEYISLPGRVRAITGRVEDGNASIYVDGAFHRFEGGRAVGQVATVHGVLVTGFDVYTQDPERTIVQLEELGIDLDRITEAAWQGRPAWVVSARPDDPDTPQLWVEKERLLCVRVVSRRPSGVLDVEMGGYEPLGEGWIATDLVFKRDGVAVLREDYAEFRTLDAIDPALFDVTNLKTTGPLP